jgi:hypothetical protein
MTQKDRDDSINQLVETMGETYAFLQEVEPLKKVRSHEAIIISLMMQTINCGYFVRDYAKVKNFCMFVSLVPGGAISY